MCKKQKLYVSIWKLHRYQSLNGIKGHILIDFTSLVISHALGSEKYYFKIIAWCIKKLDSIEIILTQGGFGVVMEECASTLTA